MNKFRTLVVLGLVALLAAVGMVSVSSYAADHLEAPLVQTDGRMDINDLYAFSADGNTTMIMTVNPLAGVANPTTLRPSPGDRYIFHVDNDGDAESDIDIILRARRARNNGRQRYDVYMDWTDGGRRRVAAGNNEQTNEFLRSDGQFWVGVADDPFFFDLQAFLDSVKGAGGSRDRKSVV